MATVPIPISRQVRATRTAISPRLAMRIFRMPTAAHPTRKRDSVGGARRRPRVLRAEPERVDRLAGQIDLVVQMRPGGAAAAAGARDHLAFVDVLPVADQQGIVVTVRGDHPAAVIE